MKTVAKRARIGARFSIAAVAAGLVLAIANGAIARPRMVEEPPPLPAPDDDKMATYSWLYRNVFSMCMYCHVSVPGVSFGNHRDTIKHVVPEHPELSRLYIMVATRRMPKGRGGLPEVQIRAIRNWIAKGAKDD